MLHSSEIATTIGKYFAPHQKRPRRERPAVTDHRRSVGQAPVLRRMDSPQKCPADRDPINPRDNRGSGFGIYDRGGGPVVSANGRVRSVPVSCR